MDCSGRFSDLMAFAIGVNFSSLTSISISLGTGIGSVEMFACGFSIEKWLAVIFLFSVCT